MKLLVRTIAVLLGLVLPGVALGQGFQAGRMLVVNPGQPMAMVLPLAVAAFALSALAATARWTSAGLIASGAWLVLGVVAVMSRSVLSQMLDPDFVLGAEVGNSLFFGSAVSLPSGIAGFGIGRLVQERASAVPSLNVKVLWGLAAVLLMAGGGAVFLVSMNSILELFLTTIRYHFSAALGVLVGAVLLVAAGFSAAWWRPSAAAVPAVMLPAILIYASILQAGHPLSMNEVGGRMLFTIGPPTSIPILLSWVVLSVVGYRRTRLSAAASE